jgi:hypothetical protein
MIGFINTYFTITLNHNQFTTAHSKSSTEPLTAEDSLHSHSRSPLYSVVLRCTPLYSVVLLQLPASESRSHIATGGQLISKSWTAMVLFSGSPSLTRGRVSFVYAAGPRQHSLSRVSVPWDSWPYFTVSDLRLHISSPPRLAGSRWRYSNPPPHGYHSLLCPLIIPLQGSHGKHFSSVVLKCVFIGPLPSNGCPSIVDSVTPELCLLSRCLVISVCFTIFYIKPVICGMFQSYIQTAMPP